MKVIKFGGTSVGSVQALLQLKRIVEQQAERPVVIVVSAIAGMTDFLIKTARIAAEGNTNYLTELNLMKNRHFSLIEGIFAPEQQKPVIEEFSAIFDELGNIFQGVALIRELSDKSEDVIVSYGERLSSLMISRMLNIPHYDARQLIKTNYKFGKHIVNFEQTSAAIKAQLSQLPALSVMGGFISSDAQSGEITNIGRGGSDYTAAILASELKASILEIWTDVDGFMTADPKVINNAYVIENLSYVEAMELSNFGAKVIYPPTIFPVYHKNIPIRIKNTFNPGAPGTYISKDKTAGEGKAIKGISSIPDTSLITIQGMGMVGVIGVNYRIFKTLAKAGISVFLVSQASSENTTSIGVRNADAELTVKVLKEEFSHEIEMGEINEIFAENELATVAIVGEGMKRTTGIAGKLFTTLGRNGINVIACAQGASETNISFVIKLDHLRKSLNVIHDSFFLSEYQVLNVFLTGIGTVGGSLLDQIRQQQPKLMSENGLKLNVVGIADIDKAIFSREGIDLEQYKELLKSEGKASNPVLLRDEILNMNIFNSVFVDCTASPDIAALYEDLLSHNVSVVAANKIAASSNYDNYARLKELARRKGVKYLFETNVGAGLPIINTMNSLIHSGDRILKMEAVLSGTLNFIFNTISAEKPLSKTIKMAQEARFSEP
ncbi:MAG: bifunctional aspartate kinase/homoserine dehydrogenase I, partial [Bacteroidales bacterium]|nr:bifunctional aspartate kinase/homoserine dehydrogenase I [Bacteroidales bacterium]